MKPVARASRLRGVPLRAPACPHCPKGLPLPEASLLRWNVVEFGTRAATPFPENRDGAVLKAIILVVVVAPFVALLCAIWQLWNRAIGWTDVLLLVGT
jgi:hypothetical protein